MILIYLLPGFFKLQKLLQRIIPLVLFPPVSQMGARQGADKQMTVCPSRWHQQQQSQRGEELRRRGVSVREEVREHWGLSTGNKILNLFQLKGSRCQKLSLMKLVPPYQRPYNDIPSPCTTTLWKNNTSACLHYYRTSSHMLIFMNEPYGRGWEGCFLSLGQSKVSRHRVC